MNDTPANAGHGSGIALLWAALGALALLVAAPLGTRYGWWDYQRGLALALGAGAAGACIALLATVTALRALRRQHMRKAARCAAAVLAALAVTAPVAVQVVRGLSAAPIHDLTTDPGDPPRFASAALIGAPRENPIEYGGEAIARQQRAAYPDLAPLRVPLPVEAAFARAHRIATDLGWAVVEAAPQEGRIEAVATTRWFGFRDDVVIRIRAEAHGARIDLRSVSRVGRSDLGANARRIRRFIGAWRE